VATEYLGAGPVAAHLEWLTVRKRRAARERRAAAWEKRVATLEAREARVVGLFEDIRLIYYDIMYLSGHYLHKRQWRKAGPRMNPDSRSPEFRRALEDRRARLLFESATDVPALVEKYAGRPGRVIARSLVELIAPDDALQREAIRREMERMREELLGKASTAIEALLVEQVVVCWIDLEYARREAYLHEAKEKFGAVAGDWYGRRESRALRRFLAATRALATVRKLAVPVAKGRAAG
jgi:hypothetical protein